jgi:rSAM/selenodomain-associated transferase 1
VPGQVKTRLCPPLTPDEAASLHGSLVLDVLERTRQAAGPPRGKPPRPAVDRFIACSPSPDHVFFKVLEGREGVRLLPQVGDDLGARMRHAFEAVLGMGYRRAVLTGSDLPTIPAAVYAEALAKLNAHDLVLGPSRDGGYYLIGLRKTVPELFAGVPWSTAQVFDVTMEKAHNLRLTVAVLPPGRDVDTIEDVRALIDEAELWSGQRPRHNRPSAGPLSARTAGVLRLLASRLPSRPPA